jgi:hypothetical protein
MNVHTFFRDIVLWTIAIALAMLPLFFLPITEEYYDTNKWTLLVAVMLITLFVWAYKSLKQSNFAVSRSSGAIGLGAITLASLVSLFVSSPNKIEALLNPYGPVTFAALTLIVTLTPTLFDTVARRRLLWLLYGCAAILSLIAVYGFFGMGKIMFPSVPYLSTPLWTPIGSSVALLVFGILLIPLLLSRIAGAWKTKAESHVGLLVLLTGIILGGIGITFFQTASRFGTDFLPLADGWMIMLEILKSPKQAIAGAGAENFLAAFSAGRPMYANLSPLWNVRFTTNATTFFHLVTIYGLLGGAACLLFAKSLIVSSGSTFRISLLLGLISFFIAPPNISILVVLAIILILSADPKNVKVIKIPRLQTWQRIGITCVISVACAACAILLMQSYGAELTFYQSMLRARENNGTAAYNLQITAIQKNPHIAHFHIVFSQTNLALASSLASTIANAGQVSETVKDEQTKDRDLIAQFIEQAIREAKIAVSLNPYDVTAWENLARTYQQLIGVAQGAEDWTIATFNEATKRDPANPVLFLEMGSVYVRMKKYPDAITAFRRSAELKPNYANAYYNLSNAYSLHNDGVEALAAMEQAATLVDRQSDDYAIISKELDALQGNIPAFDSATPTPTPIIPPLALPTETGPDKSP